MSLSPDVTIDITSTSICAVLILVRCGYRLLSRCKFHGSCHRTWHVDDAYMAFALLPLAGRSACISLSFILNPTQTYGPVTEAAAAARNLSVAQLEANYITSRKLLIPGRICYALFLWSLKLCLLSFYSRFVYILHRGHAASKTLWWSVIISFLIILIPTLGECRPLQLLWASEKDTCQRAVGNLITMGILNIITDFALVAFPLPIFRYVKLDIRTRISLIFLFCLAGLLVAITIMRLSLILTNSVSQRSRSMWASIEILCACVVANTSFYYALLKDVQRGHDSRVTITSHSRQNDFYLQSIPSTAEQAPDKVGLEMRNAARGRSQSDITIQSIE